jgi:hypothetical protein
MTRLRDLLVEITLGSVEPYATSFQWSDRHGDGDEYRAGFVAEEPGREPQDIMMTMHHWAKSQLSDSGAWEFAYYVRTPDGQGWTVRGDRGAAVGNVNYLRLIRTIGAAIRDFVDTTPNVDVIDITGSDEGMGEKGPQKSAIYRQLLAVNPMMSEFDTREWGGKLYMVRRLTNRYDATGIKDEPTDAEFQAADSRAQAAAWGAPTSNGIRLTAAERERIENP